MDNQNNRNKQNLPGNNNPNNKNNRQRWNIILFTVMLISFIVFALYQFREDTDAREITYDQFLNMVDSGEVKKVVIEDDKIMITAKTEAEMKNSKKKGASESDVVEGSVADNNDSSSKDSSDDSTGLFSNVTRKQYYTGIVKDDTLSDRLYKAGVEYEQKIPDSTSYMVMNLLVNIVPLVIMIGLGVMLMRRMTKGGGMMGVGKSNAKMYVEKSTGVTFKDVAGQAEAKQEVEEIVEFLKQPQKYTELGGKIPKGALLVGPPGTGKTLLAKAVAGEADVPFFSLSGSDFVEMFVGVGASRVRDLFRQAKEKAPCIIFIDEIDAVGRARGKNPSMGGNDERENTLNQLLTEMDGFGSNSGVIILAATNRVDILDKALLRAGRFDRQIHVDLPDLNERKEVFGVHLKPLKLDESVDLDLLARQTPGFSGADIANVCNEAALIAARHGKNAVGKQDFLDAVDRIIGGLEKKTKIMTAEEKRTIALHEAGHATLSWFLEHANPLIKVTIVPRGRALGAAWYLPEERQITTKEQMLDEMCATLGGRAAEELFTGHISTGAMNDLERVTKQSYGMIAYAGMSEKLPNLCYYSNDEYSFSKPYSERTAELIDEEVKRMINEQYDRAKAILSEHKDGHNELARLLVEKEVIFAEDVERIFGKRPWTSRSEEIMALEATAKPVEVTEDFEEKNSSDSEEKEKEKKEA